MAHVCGACVALLEPDDGHDRCPSCLGFEHLREGLTERACMNCGSMPLALRLARLAAVEHPAAADLPLMTPPPPAQPGRSWRRGRAGPPPRKRARDELASKVDRLSSDMVRIQELLLTLQPGAGGAVADSRPDPSLGDVPGTDDVLSLAASANLFSEGVTGEEDSNAFGEASRSSAQSSGHSTEVLALSTSLQQAAVEPSTQDLSDASLQAFALMSRELGRVMSTLVQTRRQVWLAQSPLTEACRKALRAVPVVPGLEPPRLPPGAATSHHALTQREMRTYVGLGGLPSSPLIAFAPPPAHRPGSLGPRSLIGTPPEPVEAGGPGARTTGPVVGCFSQQQISYWAACTTDPWVVSTLTRGAGRSLLFIQFLQLLGKLAAASAVVPLGLLSLRPLQMWLNSLHLDAKWVNHQGGTRRDLLSQLGGQIWHPDPSRLQLWAWPLQGPTHC
ncbi:unnamed protein product [Boreogadus saida]